MNFFDTIRSWMADGNFSFAILVVNAFQTLLMIVQIVLSIVLIRMNRKNEKK